ncbi:MAG: hypothetical protein JXA78_10780 [Anaerolineales bacterium]|nr:hypothetical protein [Anaerolineales bacterium]
MEYRTFAQLCPAPPTMTMDDPLNDGLSNSSALKFPFAQQLLGLLAFRDVFSNAWNAQHFTITRLIEL